MAVELDHAVVKSFDDWYDRRDEDERTGCIRNYDLSKAASATVGRYRDFKREMDARCVGFYKLEALADAEVISPKPDLPNVSSGETAGIVRRMARNLVQNVPNVEINSVFDDESIEGVLADYLLRSKIIGADQYSSDMQQNLFSSTKTSLTIGFDCVIPVLTQTADGQWIIEYDTIHHRDVFPEPGAKDVRKATEVFVRRYLTRGEIKALAENQASGWDVAALRTMLTKNATPPAKAPESNTLVDRKRRLSSPGYPVITWYTSSGAPFLTFCETSKMLLRIEKNKHPLKTHPVFFLVLEKDAQHPLGKSQVELLLGRQEFQDLMHNGAMKLWYRNINPPLLGYGAINAMPNLSPGKYTSISNPNARIEPFEVNTQTLMQYSTISQGNLGSMVSMVGAADQQMAVQAGNGFSATPQGVDAQQAMVDITTNNYQKAIEQFFSHYCSYALTIYFQELKGISTITPSAEARLHLLDQGIPESEFNDDGSLEADFSKMAVNYYVRCVPGSLVEMEDEKQLRILNNLFIPLSQAMPALVQTQDENMIRNATMAMQFIIERQIELSGSNKTSDLTSILQTGKVPAEDKFIQQVTELGSVMETQVSSQEATAQAIAALQEQIRTLTETQLAIFEKLGISMNTSGEEQPMNPEASMSPGAPAGMVESARA